MVYLYFVIFMPSFELPDKRSQVLHSPIQFNPQKKCFSFGKNKERHVSSTVVG